MSKNTGVYKAKKKNGVIYYRSSITYKNKHISLGSYKSVNEANKAYLCAKFILEDMNTAISKYESQCILSYEKWVILHNYRDSGYYFRNPIELKKNYFIYHMDIDTHLYFDADDLFYYSSHPIHKRGGYLFVNDYGMQINILSRYGIRNHGVEGQDYEFIDGNRCNFRYDNLLIHNPYAGVVPEINGHEKIYKSWIHLNGNHLIGRYSDIHEAAIAYNKAVDYVLTHCISHKNFPKNYIQHMTAREYRAAYDNIILGEAFLRLASDS